MATSQADNDDLEAKDVTIMNEVDVISAIMASDLPADPDLGLSPDEKTANVGPLSP